MVSSAYMTYIFHCQSRGVMQMSNYEDTTFKQLSFEKEYSFRYTDADRVESCSLHRHPEFEFIYNQADSASYQIGDEVIIAEKGDLLFVWPNELHTFIRVPDKVLFVQFKASILTGYEDIVSDLPLLYPLHLIRASQYPEVANAVSYSIVEGYRYYTSSDDYVQSVFRSRLTDLLTSLLYFVKQKPETVSAGASETVTADPAGQDWSIRSKIADACRYIDQNFNRNLTQTEVADLYGFSHYYFSRKFKQLTSCSFPEYLSQKRVLNASELLKKTPMTITEVAYSSGFQSISSFNKIFRDAFEMSPKEYRKMASGE